MEISREVSLSAKMAVSEQRPSVQETIPPPSSHSSSRASGNSWRPSVFDFKSGGKCPTCHGTGRLPRGQDEELVALIPYSDKRLKPRRRWYVYVAILLLVLVLVSGSLLLGFMFPRSASITLVAMNSSTALVPYSNHSNNITVLMNTSIHIKNHNFFSMRVDWLRISLYNIDTLVSSVQLSSFSVGAKGDSVAVVRQNATFTGSLADRVRTICTGGGGWRHCLYMLAEAEMQYTVLSHGAEAINSKHFFVSCDFVEESDWTESNSCAS